MTYTTPEDITAAAKTNVEAALSLAHSLFAGAERFAPLTLSATRSAMEDAANGATQLLNVKSPQDLFALQATFAQPGLEKFLAYSRSAYDVAVKNQTEITKLMEAQFADMTKGVATALDAAAKNAPVGSDAAIAAIKSALVSANAAYDGLSKAAKQASEMATSGITQATEAAMKASSAAHTGLKKVA